MIKLKNKILTAFCCLGLGISAQAQNFYTSSEYGLQFGVSSYFGDLNPNYSLKSMKPAVGFFYRNHLNPYISVRGMINYTKLGYDDQLSNNPFQKIRNLNFKSDIFELTALGEFNFFWFETGNKNRRFTPYLALGFSAFHFSPYTTLNGKKYHLRDLGTEGQNTQEYKDRKYGSFSFSVPFGVGIKYWISPGTNLGFEIIHRFTFTDYLDDVSKTYVGIESFGNTANPTAAQILQDPSLSIEGNKLGRAGKQRGDRASYDEYLMIQFTLSLQLKTYKCPSHLKGEWD